MHLFSVFYSSQITTRYYFLPNNFCVSDMNVHLIITFFYSWFLIFICTMSKRVEDDQDLRRRLMAFNTVVPPITDSTRALLLRKLSSLETPDSKKQTKSPKSNDISLINVSNWNHSASEDEDKNSYLFTGLLPIFISLKIIPIVKFFCRN